MAGNIYACSPEGVTALLTMSSGILSAAEAIMDTSKYLRTVVDENHDNLGPHESSISDVIDEIESLVKSSAEPVQDISDALKDVADDYQDIIGDDRIRGFAGN